MKELKNCFAHYDKDDIVRALRATHNLFAGSAKAVSEMLGYHYPYEVEKCAKGYINK